MARFKVLFQPENKAVTAEKGTTILNAAMKAGIFLNASCGGNGVCGRCKVIVRDGSFSCPPSSFISPKDRKKGVVLSCMTLVEGNLEVLIPAESRLNLEREKNEVEKYLSVKKIFARPEPFYESALSEIALEFSRRPLTSRHALDLPEPTFDDRLSDLERVYRALEDLHKGVVFHTSLASLQNLGQLLRDTGWRVSVLIAELDYRAEVISIDPADEALANYGMAFDIGTTTITGQLVDTATGKVISSKTAHNKQAVFGSDVITRIVFAKDREGLEKLHEAVCDNINQITQDILKEQKIKMNEVTSVVCAGNTTMTHLLLRIDPTHIRKEPYVPSVNVLPVIGAAEAGIAINPRGVLYCSPGVSTYVGGDITSGILAIGMADRPEVCMLIDIGTNGEIAMGNSEWMVACAASAGPAFEGTGVTCGMRATDGAIEKVRVSPNLTIEYETINDKRPKGICGSGYISLISGLLKNKIIDRDGRINGRMSNKRIRKGEDGIEFVVAFKKEGATEADIIITDADLDNLKRAKGAIYSACTTLLRKMDMDFEEIDKIYIAGGFGRSIDIEKAVSIGLLPDIPKDKFVFAGNTSLRGARQMLLSSEARRRTEEIARDTTYIELSIIPEYMAEYTSSLFFPHTDIERFPSVKGI